MSKKNYPLRRHDNTTHPCRATWRDRRRSRCLIAARELRREGHKVVVFEPEDQLGGTWVYTPVVEPWDPLGLDQCRGVVHSSLYLSLLTNLPREVMGFRDYPFLPKKSDEREDRDPRRFPGHAEVLAYSEEFLLPSLRLVRFGTEVLFANLVGNGKWKVRSKKRGDHDDDDEVGVEEVFDAVVVCNGHILYLVLLKFMALINGQGSKCTATTTVFQSHSEIR